MLSIVARGSIAAHGWVAEIGAATGLGRFVHAHGDEVLWAVRSGLRTVTKVGIAPATAVDALLASREYRRRIGRIGRADPIALRSIESS
jgi:hypothetical protein